MKLVDAWSGPGTSNEIPRISSEDPNNNDRISDRWVEDGSYLRLKTLELGYSFDPEKLNAINMKTLRLYISINNLFTLTKYSGLDPVDAGPEDRPASVRDRDRRRACNRVPVIV